MAPSQSDLLGKWNADPDIDDFFQSVEFREDGSGTVESAGGHALCLLADFRWDLEEGGRVALHFEKTERKPWPTYSPSSGLTSHQVRCELEAGEFPLRVPAVMGTITYRRRLRFDESPLPRDAARYHAQSLFFSVVNQVDPRQFLVFYARPEASDVVPDPRPARPAQPEPVDWRTALMQTHRLRFTRVPESGNKNVERRKSVLVVADDRFLLETFVMGGGRVPIERIVWNVPMTTTLLGELAANEGAALRLSLGDRIVGQVTQLGERIELLGPDNELLAREEPTALWCSRFERPGGTTLATRAAPTPNSEQYMSDLELNSDCSEVERLLLIGAGIVALERDRSS